MRACLIGTLSAGLLAACTTPAARPPLAVAALPSAGEAQLLLTIAVDGREQPLVAALQVDRERLHLHAYTPLGVPVLAAMIDGERLSHEPRPPLPAGLAAEPLLADLAFAWWPWPALTAAFTDPRWQLHADGDRRTLRWRGQPQLEVTGAGWPPRPTMVLHYPVTGVTIRLTTQEWRTP